MSWWWLLVVIGFVVACHYVAKKRGRDPVFWGIMGAILGPLALLFLLLSNRTAKNN